MRLRIKKLVSQRPFASAALMSLFALLTAAVTWLWAHEGHEALPTRGATVNLQKGLVLLSAQAREALGVQTAEVSQQALDERLAAPATLEAPWQGHAFATSRLGGKITAVHVQPGQAVAKDQALAEVESVELENLQFELLKAQNDAQLSAENLKQLQASRDQGATSEQSVQEAQAEHQKNVINREITRRKLVSLGLEEAFLDQLLRGSATPQRTLPIRSPLAGVVIHADVQVGRVIEPTEHLFEVLDLSTVWVKIGVLEKDLHRVQVGQAVDVRLTAYPKDTFHAAVRVKGMALDPQTRQGQVWAALSNPAGQAPRLLPGMFGQAELILPGQARRLIPADALVRDGAERYVFLEAGLDKEGRGQYLRKNVVVGRQAQGLVEILEGQVAADDRVVTAGSHGLASFFVQGVLRLSPEAERNIQLRIEPARRRVVAEVVQLNGEVELPPGQRAVASARLAGTIERLHVDRDQEVKTGQVVAEVASLEFQDWQLELLRSHLQLQLVEQTLQRLRPLAEQSNAALSRRQLRETESIANAARLRRDSYRRKLEAIGLTPQQVQDVLDKQQFVKALPIRAPVAGAVVHFRTALGQVVKAEDPLFEIHDLTRPVVRGYVSERQLPGVRLGQRARVRLVADPTAIAEAVVVRSGQELKTAARTLSVWAELKELPDSLLRHGMLADLTLIVAEPDPVLAVPHEAVLREGLHAYLFVRQPDGTFERRPVRTGRSDDQFVEITRGLREGEDVAVRGVNELQTAYASVK
jgi:RND family efflux transporter MFP subunit